MITAEKYGYKPEKGNQTMEKQELKQRAVSYIEEQKERLIGYGEALYAMPEPGYREYRTSSYVKKVLTDLGLNIQDKIAITGLKAKAEGKEHKANVGLMGELDALIMPGHKKAYPETGYYHGCGHHAQLTTILGAGIGLLESGVIRELDGDITFLAVPAEEVIELEYRGDLIRQGLIQHAGGKDEFIELSQFDGIDMVLCSHAYGGGAREHIWQGHSWNGILQKKVQFIGKSAHAGLAPEQGINALEAAVCAINAINALRQRFPEKDHVRVHYIITKGGESHNVVPDDVRLDMGVRASTAEMMFRVNDEVNKALRLAGESVGAKVVIRELGFSLPCHQDEALGALYRNNAALILGEENVTDARGDHRCSSTDCGDVASLIPLIHPYFGGFSGTPHGGDFEVIDPYAAYVVPAKIAVCTVIDLLYDGAKEALKIKENFRPIFDSTEAYKAFRAAHEN